MLLAKHSFQKQRVLFELCKLKKILAYLAVGSANELRECSHSQRLIEDFFNALNTYIP